MDGEVPGGLVAPSSSRGLHLLGVMLSGAVGTANVNVFRWCICRHGEERRLQMHTMMCSRTGGACPQPRQIWVRAFLDVVEDSHASMECSSE